MDDGTLVVFWSGYDKRVANRINGCLVALNMDGKITHAKRITEHQPHVKAAISVQKSVIEDIMNKEGEYKDRWEEEGNARPA